MVHRYALAWKSYMHGTDNWPLPEGLEEEEREAEILFRKNEMVITRRLVLIVITNVILWTPMVAIGALSMMGIYVSKVSQHYT